MRQKIMNSKLESQIEICETFGNERQLPIPSANGVSSRNFREKIREKFSESAVQYP